MTVAHCDEREVDGSQPLDGPSGSRYSLQKEHKDILKNAMGPSRDTQRLECVLIFWDRFPNALWIHDRFLISIILGSYTQGCLLNSRGQIVWSSTSFPTVLLIPLVKLSLRALAGLDNASIRRLLGIESAEMLIQVRKQFFERVRGGHFRDKLGGGSVNLHGWFVFEMAPLTVSKYWCMEAESRGCVTAMAE